MRSTLPEKIISASRFALLCILGSIFTTVTAVAGTLAEKPLILQQSAKPNVILAVDDSGSMDYEVLLPTNDGAAWWNTENQSFTGKDQEDEDASDEVLNYNKAGGTTRPWKKYVYLFPNGTGTGKRVISDTQGYYAIPPLPQYAWARSPMYNSSYFDPSITYQPWVSTSSSIFGDVSPLSAPSDPVAGTFTFDLTGLIERDALEYTFKMHEGMIIPAGTRRKIGSGSWATSTSDFTLTSTQDVAITYYPAVFYLRSADILPEGYGFSGARIAGYAPDGSTPLEGFEIRPGNFESPAAYQAAIQNFANWFTYYRKRHAATRGAIGKSFSALTRMRVGAFTTNNRTAVSMYDLTESSEMNTLLDSVYGMRARYVETPNREALKHTGDQYMRRDVGAPITEVCQQNFAILFTDGYSNVWTGANLGNQDGNMGSPYADTVSDTMADIAMYFYRNNLRSDLEPGQVPVHNQCLSGTPHPSVDCNTNLHMVTFAVTLGTRGQIFGENMSATADPYANPPVWPTIFETSHPSAVDDLWHATINGRGQLFNAKAPSEVSEKLTNVLNIIASRSSSMAAVTTNTTRLNDDATVYQAMFSSVDWSGRFKAVRFDGMFREELWDAAERMVAQGERRIFTFDPLSSPVPQGGLFHWSSLNDAQKAELNKNPEHGLPDGLGEQRLSYLLGERLQEQRSGGPFRDRGTILGDIVNSDPHFVWRPDYGFHPLDPEGMEYAQFRKGLQQSERPPMIYVGANDGMLHGFNAETGDEVFAYVPNALFPKLSLLTSPQYGHAYYVDGSAKSLDVYSGGAWRTVLVSGLGAGGRAVFALDVTDPAVFGPQDVLWEVDSTQEDFLHLGHVMDQPTIVRLNDGTWAALIGNGYHNAGHKAVLYLVEIGTGKLIMAIDTEADGNVGQPNGLSTPRPLDTNSDRITDVVYAGDLQGNLWKFDLSSADRSDWKVAFSNDGKPQALFTAKDRDGQTQPITIRPTAFRHPEGGIMVLFGTGQLFEVEDVVPGSLQVQTFYGIRDVGAVLSGPRAEIFQEQQIIWEDHWTYEDEEGATEEDEGIGVRILSREPVEWTEKQGWFLDLVSPTGAQGERVVSEPILLKTRKNDTAVLFNTMIPSDDPCGFGGSGWLMYFDALTGGRFDYVFLDVNGDGIVDEKDFTRDARGDLLPVSGIDPKGGKGFGNTPAVITDGGVSHLIYPMNDGSMTDLTALTAEDTTGRRSWRQIR
jgi:type IV pilus assembly protein PilY1